MKIVEVRNLTDSELVSKKKDARQEYFNLRLQQTTGALEKPSRLNELRKDVAKLETVLSERRLGLKVKSRAVKTSAPAVVDFTVKVTTPEALLTPEAALMVGVPGPAVWARVTVLPATGLPSASFKVTVMVDVVELSAGTEVGTATTVDCAAVTGPIMVTPSTRRMRATAWARVRLLPGSR